MSVITWSIRFVCGEVAKENNLAAVANYAVEADSQENAIAEGMRQWGHYYTVNAVVFAFHKFMNPNDAFRMWAINREYGYER